MEWYCLQVGIEHLTTGMFFYAIKSPNGIQFEMDSPSTFKVWSNAPFSSMWPAHQDTPHMDAVVNSEGPDMMRCSFGRAEYAAKHVAPEMVKAWTIKDAAGEPIPPVIADALIRKFGSTPLPKVVKGYPCYWFEYAGMFHGIEEDGYIHT